MLPADVASSSSAWIACPTPRHRKTALFSLPRRRQQNCRAAFLHNLKHNKVLHERITSWQGRTLYLRAFPEANRVECERLGGRLPYRGSPATASPITRRARGAARLPRRTASALRRRWKRSSSSSAARPPLTRVSIPGSAIAPRRCFISLSHSALATKTFLPHAHPNLANRNVATQISGLRSPDGPNDPRPASAGLLNTRRVFEPQIVAPVRQVSECIVPELWHHDTMGYMA